MIKHSAVYYFYSAMPPGWLNLLFAVILQSLGLRDGQAEAQRAVDRLHHSSFPQILMHEKKQKNSALPTCRSANNRCLNARRRLCLLVWLHLWKRLVIHSKNSMDA